MKKYVIMLALLTMQQLVIAQTVNVHFKNGQLILYPASSVDYLDFSEKAADPTVSSGQVVDLGLSVYWASCNVGAEEPEEWGDFYLWGETKPGNSYDNYTFYDNITKQYIDIGDDISGTQYDVATVCIGNDWRMPTKAEMQELIDNCTWDWTQINGHNGYRITGKNGNSIFLPASGKYSHNTGFLLGPNNWLGYWTSTSYDNINSYFLNKQSGDYNLLWTPKNSGNCIRPVTENINAGGNPIDHSQDYLVTDKISALYTGGSIYSVNGVIQSGSVLNFKLTNGSTESIELTGIQLINGDTGSEGNNALSENVIIVAGVSKDYSITVGSLGISKPKARFTYRYNQKKYYVEASVPE